ncbi:hypothetical protein ABEW24_01950 [Paenibacillus jamilae]|uniref:hypothetical protein n=1 Tax=Paenibacillus TaxID=44249 RepID=UPI00077C4B65|nr:hypothetical protein [Paenibacillus polymyxa]KYG97048.1 hypothetical protein AZE31_25175 [Paenibacillus polymyxa]
MCRYAMYGPYKDIFACFTCRKVFKQTSRFEMSKDEYERIIHVCPQCQASMHDMGHDFQAPKQTDIKQWKKVELLYQQGYAYHSCGCGGPGYRPSRLSKVPEFLENQRTFENKGEALLYRLLQS